MKTFNVLPHLQHFLKQYQSESNPSDSPFQSKVILISGGTTGIGFEVAKQVLSLGFLVIVTSSSEKRAVEAVERIVEETKRDFSELPLCSDLEKRIVGMGMNLADLESVATSCLELCKNILPDRLGVDGIDVIINNAGVVVGDTKLNQQQISTTFSVCYLGHTLMNHLLRSKMRKGSRIVVVSSNVAKMVFSEKYKTLDDIQWMNMIKEERSISTTIPTYAYNKLFCSMYAFSLHEKWIESGLYSNIEMVNCVHPGVMMTNLPEKAKSIQKEENPIFAYLSYGMYYLIHAFKGIPISKGAYHELKMAVDRDIKCSGVYFSLDKEDREHPLAYVKEERDKLWNLTMELITPFLEKYAPLIEQH